MSDEDVAPAAKQNGKTRAVACMDKADPVFDKPIIFAIGNAPNALCALRTYQ
jgi:precorrin-8X/cobalt-precorrin-8 methylmutase